MKYLKLYEQFDEWDPFGEESVFISPVQITKNIILDNLESPYDAIVEEVFSKKTGENRYFVNFKRDKIKRDNFLNAMKSKYPSNKIFAHSLLVNHKSPDDEIVIITKIN